MTSLRFPSSSSNCDFWISHLKKHPSVNVRRAIFPFSAGLHGKWVRPQPVVGRCWWWKSAASPTADKYLAVSARSQGFLPSPHVVCCCSWFSVAQFSPLAPSRREAVFSLVMTFLIGNFNMHVRRRGAKPISVPRLVLPMLSGKKVGQRRCHRPLAHNIYSISKHGRALFARSVWDIIAHCTMQLLGEFDAQLNWKSPAAVGRGGKRATCRTRLL